MAGWTILANDMGARGKPMLITYVSGFSTVLNIVLNIFWIKRWGIEGAALSTAVSYFITFAITVLIYARTSGNKITDIIFPQKNDIIFYKNILFLIRGQKK